MKLVFQIALAIILAIILLPVFVFGVIAAVALEPVWLLIAAVVVGAFVIAKVWPERSPLLMRASGLREDPKSDEEWEAVKAAFNRFARR